MRRGGSASGCGSGEPATRLPAAPAPARRPTRRTRGASWASGSPSPWRVARSRCGWATRSRWSARPPTWPRSTSKEQRPLSDSHRSAFGEHGGESSGFIERTFRERIVLAGVTLPPSTEEDTEAGLDELEALVDTAGADVVDRVVQRRQTPDPATYIGSGKA